MIKDQILAALIAAGYAEDAGNWVNPDVPNNKEDPKDRDKFPHLWDRLRLEPEMYIPSSYAAEIAKTIEHLFGPTIRLITSSTLNELPQGKFEFQLQDNLRLVGHFQVTDALKIPFTREPNPIKEALKEVIDEWGKEH